jgi:Kelch motif
LSWERKRLRAARLLLIAFALAALLAPASAGAVNPVSFSPAGNLTTPRDGPGAARLPDGRVLIAGGYTTASLDTAEIFNPATNTFSPLGATMSSPRYGPASAALPDGRVLIAGGYKGPGDLTSADVFNPATGTFSPVGSMTVPREFAGAATLPDGRVLIVGGFSNTDRTPTTEIFDPKTNTFSAGPNFPDARTGIAVASISGGRSLLAGGDDGSKVSSVFVFNPSSNGFTGVGPLPGPAYAPAGASLPQGRALVAGGDDGTGKGITTAVIFDPATNSFSSAGITPLNHRRFEAAAAELSDGRALVAGGWDGAPVQTAEVLSVPSNAFKAKLKGRTVVFEVTNEGVASAADTSTRFVTTARKKRPKLVKTTSKHGGPGKIIVKIKLTKLGAARLAQKGKIKIKAAYTPDGGLAATKKLKLHK